MGFIKMKYEQFMMRFLDWLLTTFYFRNQNLEWYPEYAVTTLNKKVRYLDKIDRLENEIMRLEEELYFRDTDTITK